MNDFEEFFIEPVSYDVYRIVHVIRSSIKGEKRIPVYGPPQFILSKITAKRMAARLNRSRRSRR
jgi:hypothetical protein